MMDKVFFYVPDEELVELFEKSIEECSMYNNFTCWVLATYIYLKKEGFPCEITTKIPQKGILLADRDTLNETFIDFEEVMLICAKGDRDFHPSAYLHVVQNFIEFQEYQDSVWHPYYIPLWPQTQLLPRLKERGSLVENVAYVGARSQLSKKLHAQEWSKTLESLGYKWIPLFNPPQWNDYRNIDVVVAARSFDSNNLYKYKPASKLINCWRAGVPALLTPESAYLAQRSSELDFLIIDSVESAIDSLEKLKKNPSLYESMIDNGLKRAQENTHEQITKQWIVFFEKFVFPHYKEWSDFSSFKKKMMYLQRYIYFKNYALLRKFWKTSLAK